MLLAACSGGGEGIRTASATGYGEYQTIGLASWYGDEVAGNRTASGARFDPDAITAAHRTLPLGSYAEVTSLDTGQSIVVLINDRGPGRRDRVIDLSRGAAQRLGFGGRSVANVRVRALAPSMSQAAWRPAPPVARPRFAASPDVALDSRRRYFVQVASFSDEDRARALAQSLNADVVPAGSLYRVRTGAMSASEAQRARDAVAARGYGDAQILPAD